MYLSFSWGLLRRFLSFTGERYFSRIWLKAILLSSVQRFCSTLSPERAVNRRLYPSISVLKLKIPLQISSDEKALFLARKALANHLAPFSSSTSSGHATQRPTFPSPSTRLWSAGSLTCILTALAVSRWAC